MTSLQVGQPAPDFSLLGDDDREHKLSELRGRTVVLYFYPRDATPGCTVEACDFRDRHAAFLERDAVVIGVSADSAASHRKFKEKQGLPFLLLCDPGNIVSQQYGAYGEKVLYGKKSTGIIRSTFVIGPDGHLQAIYPKVSVKGHAEQVLGTI